MLVFWIIMVMLDGGMLVFLSDWVICVGSDLMVYVGDMKVRNRMRVNVFIVGGK